VPGRRLAFRLAVVAAIVVAGVDAAWTYWQFGGERATQYWSDLIAVPVPAATAIVCWVAARRREGRARRAWVLLGAAAMSWAIGEAIWSYYELGLGREVPFPSLADVGFLGLIPLAVAGMLSFPSAPGGLTARARTLLDGLIITGSLLFVSWHTVLGPTYRESSGTLETLIGLAYPIGDIAILSIVLFIALRVARGHRGALMFIGAGLGVLALADSGFIYQNLHNTYASGSLIDPLWEVGFLLMMLGGVQAIPHAEVATDDRGPHPVSQLLPYLGVVTVVVMAAVLRVSAPLEIVLFWTMLAVLLFVVTRQLLTMYDNVVLTRTLESRVRELVDHDIAERERVEREREELQMHLNHARRLESLGQMAGAISHDFNNILGVIMGFASLTRGELDQRLKTASPEDREAIELSLEQIEKASERAANLTNQLVTFSRREPSQARVIDLNQILRDFERFLRQTVSESVELRVTPAPEPMMIKADPAQIEQVLTNLALNARDAMSDGGRLTIATSAAMVDEDEARFHPGLSAGRHVRLIVRDTGLGMTADVAVRAFDPFFTTKPKGSGAGLGLATAYGIVSQAGGTIRVDSAPGAGATFTIHLPESHEAPSSEDGARSIDLGGAPELGGRILVVEDDPSMLTLVAVTLRESGYEVVQAANGVEALAVAERSGPIDAVLTDVVMPQMSGPDLILRLRRTRPDLPAVCMSGYAEPIVNPGDIGEGVRFIGKPFTPDRLLAVLREALSQRVG
jgi:signal transduction histidine kinase